MNARFCTKIAIVAATAAAALGCSHRGADQDPAPTATSVSVDAAKFQLAEEPEGAIGVIQARSDAEDGDPVVLVGRIGGSTDPWIKGRSAFVMVDSSMVVIEDGTEEAEGEICLEECCAALRKDCTTLVKFVDDEGRVLSGDARELVDADVDDLVVVKGHVERDAEEGAFVIIADGVHVKR